MPEILHITTRARWEQAIAQGEYRVDTLATEGFIHCSTSEQLPWVVEKFYKGQTGLVVLRIDTQKLVPPLKWENPHESLEVVPARLRPHQPGCRHRGRPARRRPVRKEWPVNTLGGRPASRRPRQGGLVGMLAGRESRRPGCDGSRPRRWRGRHTSDHDRPVRLAARVPESGDRRRGGPGPERGERPTVRVPLFEVRRQADGTVAHRGNLQARGMGARSASCAEIASGTRTSATSGAWYLLRR